MKFGRSLLIILSIAGLIPVIILLTSLYNSTFHIGKVSDRLLGSALVVGFSGAFSAGYIVVAVGGSK